MTLVVNGAYLLMGFYVTLGAYSLNDSVAY